MYGLIKIYSVNSVIYFLLLACFRLQWKKLLSLFMGDNILKYSLLFYITYSFSTYLNKALLSSTVDTNIHVVHHLNHS
jgi:hypothetical protein